MASVETLAGNVAAGLIGPDETAWLKAGIAGWLSAGGAVPLETCLHLPRTASAMDRAARNMHLRAAWLMTKPSEPWLKSVALERELKEFEARVWPRWKSDDSLMVGGSEMRLALYAAKKTGAHIPTTARHLHRLCHQV